MNRIATYIEKATAAFEAGFTTKAAQKDALDYVNRAFSEATKEMRALVLEIPFDDRQQGTVYHDVYWALPMYPHEWKAKHESMVLAIFPEATNLTNIASTLVDLRNAIKSAEIIKTTRVSELEAQITERVQKMVSEVMAQRKQQFQTGLSLYEIFGHLFVTVNTHMVTNQFGTTFQRNFYYMNNKLTPLNIIIAAYQEGARIEEEQKKNQK